MKKNINYNKLYNISKMSRVQIPFWAFTGAYRIGTVWGRKSTRSLTLASW